MHGQDDRLRVKKRMRCNLVHGVGWWALNCACCESCRIEL